MDNVSVQRAVDRCSTDIIDLIIEQLECLEWRYYYRDLNTQLRMCALVGRKWRRAAQRALHRMVILSPRNYKSRLGVYTRPPRTNGSWAAMDVWQFPRTLIVHVLDPSRGYCDWLNGVCGFARRCGQLITRIQLYDLKFKTFEDLARFIGLFPSVRDLCIEHCSWGPTPLQEGRAMAFHSHDHNILHAPSSLRDVHISFGWGASGEESTHDVLSLAVWLMHSSGGDLRSVELVSPFSFQVTDIEATCTALRLFGPKLVKATLIAINDKHNLRRRRPVPGQDTPRFPDLSHNTALGYLELADRMQGRTPPTYLESVLATVSSTVLTRVLLRTRPNKVENLATILTSAKFASLESVELCIKSGNSEGARSDEVQHDVLQQLAVLKKNEVLCRVRYTRED
ncbi:hypothetical protein BC835DRAFT_1422142 [Cytidiella melzeri]|nr:hypothetical protein BC835DRAFT_1422142 [Cytidiella melzeri]